MGPISYEAGQILSRGKFSARLSWLASWFTNPEIARTNPIFRLKEFQFYKILLNLCLHIFSDPRYFQDCVSSWALILQFFCCTVQSTGYLPHGAGGLADGGLRVTEARFLFAGQDVLRLIFAREREKRMDTEKAGYWNSCCLRSLPPKREDMRSYLLISNLIRIKKTCTNLYSYDVYRQTT